MSMGQGRPATIDSHCHASSRWYEPLDVLLFQMDRCGVERAVLIQLLGAMDEADMRAAHARHPDRFAWVGTLDPQQTDWRDTLHRAVDRGAAGLRMRAGWRSPGEDPLALWREAERMGLRISLVGPATDFCDGKLADVAENCPGLTLVLEHLGGLARPDVGDIHNALHPVCDLAALPNIMLKLPGLGQLTPRLRSVDGPGPALDLAAVLPVLTATMEAYGPDRLMWGSDFPPVAAREGYAHALDWCRDQIEAQWPQASPAVFGGTAQRVWFER